MTPLDQLDFFPEDVQSALELAKSISRAKRRGYDSTPKAKARRSSPEYKEIVKARLATPAYKAIKKAYAQSPRGRERARESEAGRKTAPDWREKRLAYLKQLRRNNIQHRLAVTLRARFNCAFHGNSKGGSAVRDLGCSIAELKIRLEAMFRPGMTWENHGVFWHIDHWKPISSFDLTIPEQFRQACHYINLQPMYAADNLKKKAKWDPANDAVFHEKYLRAITEKST